MSQLKFATERSYNPTSYAQMQQHKARTRREPRLEADPRYSLATASHLGVPATTPRDSEEAGALGVNAQPHTPESSVAISPQPNGRNQSIECTPTHPSAVECSTPSQPPPYPTAPAPAPAPAPADPAPLVRPNEKRARKRQGGGHESLGRHSSKRPRIEGMADREETGRNQESRNGSRICDFCGTESKDDGYSCNTCETNLCSRCIVNAPFVHPEPGHSFERVGLDPAPRVTDAPPDGSNAPSETSEADDLSNTDQADDVQDVEKTERDLYQCWFCDQKLSDVRYECQSCPNTNFCSNCSALHHKSHTLIMRHICEPERQRKGRVAEHASEQDMPVVDQTAGSGDDDTVGVTNNARNVEDNGSARLSVTEHSSVQGSDEESGQEDDESCEEDDSAQGDDLDQGESGQEDGSDDPDRDIDAVNDTDWVAEDIPTTQKRPGNLHSSLAAEVSRIVSRDIGRRLSKAVGEAINRALSQVLAERSESISATGLKTRQRGLLDFDVNLAADSSPAKRTRRGPSRQWLDADRQKLARLKAKGWTVDAIGAKMRRTAGAVQQLWRKQQHSL